MKYEKTIGDYTLLPKLWQSGETKKYPAHAYAQATYTSPVYYRGNQIGPAYWSVDAVIETPSGVMTVAQGTSERSPEKALVEAYRGEQARQKRLRGTEHGRTR